MFLSSTAERYRREKGKDPNSPGLEPGEVGGSTPGQLGVLGRRARAGNPGGDLSVVLEKGAGKGRGGWPGSVWPQFES